MVLSKRKLAVFHKGFGPAAFDDYLAVTYPSIDWHKLQELTGSVALATNSALALGRELVDQRYASFLPEAGWSHLGGEVAHCDGSQVATTLLTQPGFPDLTGKTVTVVFTISNFSAGLLRYRIGADQHGTFQNSNGVFSDTVVVSATSPTSVSLQGDAFFIADIDLKLFTIKQTDIAASSDFPNPGDNPMDLTNTGMTIGQAGAGNVPYMYLGDGITTRLEFTSVAERNSKINMDTGSKIVVATSTTWAAGIDVLSRDAVDADNEIIIYRSGTDLICDYKAGGVSSSVTIPSGSPAGLFDVGFRWDVAGTGVRAFYQGEQSGSDVAIGSAIIGNLDQDLTVLFANSTSGTNSWDGKGAYFGISSISEEDFFFSDFHSKRGA